LITLPNSFQAITKGSNHGLDSLNIPDKQQAPLYVVKAESAVNPLVVVD